MYIKACLVQGCGDSQALQGLDFDLEVSLAELLLFAQDLPEDFDDVKLLRGMLSVLTLSMFDPRHPSRELH